MSYLTERQKEILEFIQVYRRERGIAPTHREICEKFGFSSYGTAYKHLKLLQQKGFLRRDWNQKRGIELIRAIPGNETTERDLPFFGQIAAGRPIEALSGNDRVTVPGHLLSPRGGEHYVLRVVGESMIDEGIHDGDFVIVLRRDLAEPGRDGGGAGGGGRDPQALLPRGPAGPPPAGQPHHAADPRPRPGRAGAGGGGGADAEVLRGAGHPTDPTDRSDPTDEGPGVTGSGGSAVAPPMAFPRISCRMRPTNLWILIVS